ncbi:metallophosphoesterase family protein [Phocaeicola abscessus]
MKRREAIKKVVDASLLIGAGTLSFPPLSCQRKHEDKSGEKFSFAFFADVHLLRDNDRNSHIGFQRALDDVLPRGIDFILFGGDNIDAYHLQEVEAEVLYERFKDEVGKRGLKAYYTIGNHDTYYTPVNRKADPHSFALHQKYFGALNHSFDYKGVHFIVLNSVNHHAYEERFCVGEEQCAWLKQDLEQTGRQMPVVVSMHVPIQTLYHPVVDGKIDSIDMITDFKQVWDMLDPYNVKIVLQGHEHLYEQLFVKDTQFLTGGAVSSGWWEAGDFYKTDKGYLLVHVDTNNNFTWEYIAYVHEKEGKERWEYTRGASQYNNA